MRDPEQPPDRFLVRGDVVEIAHAAILTVSGFSCKFGWNGVGFGPAAFFRSWGKRAYVVYGPEEAALAALQMPSSGLSMVTHPADARC